MVFIVDSRVEELKEEGFEALLFIVDVLDWENLLESKQCVFSEWGCIDIFINVVGGNKFGVVVQFDQEIFDFLIFDFNQVVQFNLQGIFLFIMVFGEVMVYQ